MRAPVRLLVSAVAVFALPMVVAVAQDGGAAAGAPAAQRAQPGGTMPPPKNLQVLPKDISGEQLIAKMRAYEGALGVGCGFCHANDPATGKRDFASDANPKKETARTMITMTAAINQNYLAKLPGGMHMDDEVSCGTCHQGHEHPPAFVPKPREQQQGAPGGATPPAGL
jgi:hypothetical protein